MSNFNSRPTQAYLAAVDALKKIPLEARKAALADATAEKMRDLADKQLGKPLRGKKTWRKLIGESGKDDDELPGDDHVELRQGKVLSYVSHPYQLEFSDLKDIMGLCMANGLEVRIDAKSWYYPGATIRVTYTARKHAPPKKPLPPLRLV